MSEERPIVLIALASQGNPGAIKVLCELESNFPGEFVGLEVARHMFLTGSKAPNLWLVYKDECDSDIKKTREVLERWRLAGVISLGKWLADQNLKISKEAAYYG